MSSFPKAIQKIIEHFDALPGIGPKHAARLALYVVSNRDFARTIAQDLDAATADIRFCSQCQTITDKDLCALCSDATRDQSSICVVAHVQDIDPIERTGKYNGTYHILHGAISPLDGITPDQVKIKELMDRVQKNDIGEVILALDATSEGEATSLYLAKILHETPINVSKLARGIPVGSNIEYTDEVTLSSALENRKKV